MGSPAEMGKNLEVVIHTAEEFIGEKRKRARLKRASRIQWFTYGDCAFRVIQKADKDGLWKKPYLMSRYHYAKHFKWGLPPTEKHALEQCMPAITVRMQTWSADVGKPAEIEQ